MESNLAGIPMPPQNSHEKQLPPRDDRMAAWEKAQEALKKVNVSAASTSSSSTPSMMRLPRSQSDIQAQMLQYYPWMAQPVLGTPPFVPRPPPPPPPPASFCPSSRETHAAYPGPYFATSSHGGHTQPPPPPPPTLPPPPQSACGYRPDFVNPPWPSSSATPRPPPRHYGFFGSQTGGDYTNRNNNHLSQQQKEQQQQNLVRFSINRPRGVSAAPAFRQNSPLTPLESASIPDTVRRYVERSYMAVEKKEDRDKLEEYFKQKLNPLLLSGAYKAVDWEREPLPSELNFEVKMGWTPASELKKSANAIAEMEKRAPKKSKFEMGHRKGSTSPTSFREHSKKKLPFSPRVRLPSGDDNSVEEALPKHKQTAAQKKKKKKKNSEKAAGRWVADERSNAQREERARRFARDEEVRRAKFSEMRRRLDWCIDREGGEGTSDNIVGTCTDVEKSYFRLTSAPDPSAIRPLEILEKALKLVKEKYMTNRDYTYANDQLRSIRQDLMIQCIRTDFTVNVYETNARIALEQGDREEFNQCQSQLKLLYKEIPNSPNRYEFTSYRLLYYISVASTIDQTTLLSELDEKARDDPCVAFALKTREAWALGNYVKLFRLYDRAPRMASYVMDLFLERERKIALNACLKSFRPTITVSALASILGLEETKLCGWLATLGIAAESGKIDCRTYNNAITV